MRIEWGSLVRLDYDILLDSGKHLGSSDASGPIWIRVGDEDPLPALGVKLVGLQEGEERLIHLSPPEAFGDWDLNAVLALRDAPLASDPRLRDGMRVWIETRDGSGAFCRVYRIAEDRVALDFNHPIAGQPLTLFVRVLQVAPPGVRGRAPAR